MRKTGYKVQVNANGTWRIAGTSSTEAGAMKLALHAMKVLRNCTEYKIEKL